MNQDEILPGKEYALREPPRPGVRMERVRVVERVRAGRWRVEWMEPDAGLTDFVKSANLIVPWKDHKRYLRDERDLEAITRTSQDSWPGDDHPLDRAVATVFTATGERFDLHKGLLQYHEEEAIERVAARAGIEVPVTVRPVSTRNGTRYRAFADALNLAQAFAAAEPQTVLLEVEAAEREWETRAREPGGRYLISLVNEHRAEWALVRQWAGMDKAVARREQEIKGLRELLVRVMWDLRSPGVDPLSVAARIERSLVGT